MNIFIFVLAVIVAYPMFMMAAYLFSKGIFNQQKEFSELNLRRKKRVGSAKKEESHTRLIHLLPINRVYIELIDGVGM